MRQDVALPPRHGLAGLLATLMLFAVGCTSLPQAEQPPASFAYESTQGSSLGEVVQPLVDDNAGSGEAGFHLLDNGLDALAARLQLIEEAEISLDIQSFEFRDQASTWLVMLQLLDAADRGVRVRLLVDDWGMMMDDDRLTALAEHPRLEIRLFNPFAARNVRAVDYIGHFSQIHRRMHNKLFIADNQVTILGGRNKGDAYFGGTQGWHYMDLDMLALGPLSEEASASFDLYWNHQLAVPISDIARRTSDGELANARARLSAELANYPLAYERLSLGNGRIMEELSDGILPLIWARYTFMADHPDKILTPPEDASTHMVTQLYEHMEPVTSDVLIVSPYMVPPETGMAQIQAWRDDDIRVRLFTNSLAANDQPIVHSGYAGYRTPLLDMGAELWEIQPQPQSERLMEQWNWVDDSSLTLHAKIMVFDDDRVFIGSPNFDPRSYNLNTEVAVLIESEALAEQSLDWFEANKTEVAWQLTLDDGSLAWVNHTNGTPEMRNDGEPEAGRFRRFGSRFWSIMPIEWML